MVTSVGATGAQNVIKALRAQRKYAVDLIGCDASPDNAGAYLVDQFHIIPMGGEPHFVTHLASLCQELQVDMLLPIMEDEILAIARHRDIFQRYFPVISDLRSIALCADKAATNELVTGIGVKCPRTFKDLSAATGSIVIKPRSGTGSNGIRFFDTPPMQEIAQLGDESVIQEFVKGQEYTVDCYVGIDKEFIACSPRKRLAVKGGLATKTLVVDHPTLVATSKRILEAIPIRGACNIQFIENESGECFFIEINPRFGGAYIASIEAGLNAPLFMLNEFYGDDIEFDG
ncbi:MAG: ATP-grasp domain-containing protein, partial [Chthonomonadales bacterium]